MFARISNTIALQFTGFIFLLLLLNGILFLAADFGNARRMSQDRLIRMSELVMRPAQSILEGKAEKFPPQMRERIRIIGSGGDTIYNGVMFEDLIVPSDPGYTLLSADNEQYAVMTIPVIRDGQSRGYIQIINPERPELREIPVRVYLYLFVSILISGLVFLVGLAFARKSLKPAEQMMQRLEQFTQDASHELRTPLATLNSSLDLALKNGEFKEGLLSAKDDVKDITQLVERLLELTRLDSLNFDAKKIDLSSMVQDAVEKHAPLAEVKNISIESKIQENIFVKGDAALIRQILHNLLSNAVKFSPTNGSIIAVRLTKQSLEVEDNGIGIKPEDLAHIFDRFFQSDPSRTNDGFGLGLALVKRIVDLHGWTIAVKSTLKKGTTVTIRFTQKEAKKAS